MSISLKEKFSTIITLLSEPKILMLLLSQRHSGYLFDQGWFNAFKLNSAVDKNNNPLPWMTYPFIDFIVDRIKKDFSIFEFGSGNSTLFFSRRSKKVVCVEHNAEWFHYIKKKMNLNIEIKLKDIPEDYPKAVNNEKYDIIIVDGIYRNECIYNSINSLSDKGILILDDSEREDYNDGKEFLLKLNFKKIDFWGFSPGLFYKKSTTVYYKTGNCLNI